MPGRPDERHELGSALRPDAVEASRRSSGTSSLRPTSGSSPACARSTPRRARGASACQTRTGSVLPFAWTGSASLVLDHVARHPVRRARRRGSMSTGAAAWILKAVFVTSPQAMPSPSIRPARRARPCLAGREPEADVKTEVRGVLVQLGDRVADRQRGANRPLGVVTVRPGGAEQREDRVADELLDRPAEALELARERSRSTELSSRWTSSGSRTLRPLRESTTSQKSAVTSLRSSSRAGSLASRQSGARTGRRTGTRPGFETAALTDHARRHSPPPAGVSSATTPLTRPARM